MHEKFRIYTRYNFTKNWNKHNQICRASSDNDILWTFDIMYFVR